MSISMLVVPTRSFRYVLHDEHTEPIDTKRSSRTIKACSKLNFHGALFFYFGYPSHMYHEIPYDFRPPVPSPGLADIRSLNSSSRALAPKSTCVTTTRLRASTLAGQRKRSSTSERTRNASGMAAGWKSQRYDFSVVCNTTMYMHSRLVEKRTSGVATKGRGGRGRCTRLLRARRFVQNLRSPSERRCSTPRGEGAGSAC